MADLENEIDRNLQLLKGMRKLGVRWKPGHAIPTYTGRMTPKQKAEADKLYDAMSEGFLDAQAERAHRLIKKHHAKYAVPNHLRGGKRRHGIAGPDVVDVLFRVVKAGEFKGSVEAWFPGLPGTNNYYRDMMTYAHMGQHGSGDIGYMQSETRPAKPSEYANLKRELESVPYEYKLRVVKRMTQKHYEQRKAACH
jgi:hypothetical protein